MALNYGSEEEEEEEEDEFEVTIPRNFRMFLEPEEDTPQESQAAGTIDSFESLEEGPVYQPTLLYSFDWGPYPDPPISPLLRREQFVGRCGPTIAPTGNPYDTFVQIWDRPIMEHIAIQTNMYAQQYATSLMDAGYIKPFSRISQWQDTDVDELYLYFGLVIAMGVTVKSKLVEYWSEDKTIFATPGFSANMPLKRFQLLNRCLHFSNNGDVPATITRSHAKIFKIKPIVDHLNEKFSSLYKLGQNIALDESLTQWKGWLDIKQHIPNKTAAAGIKTYEICESRTGYLWRFEIHAGSEPVTHNGLITGSIPNLVLRLLRGLENTGYTVWMDNYYNSPALARLLKTQGFDCVGTLRTNRLHVPEQISNLTKSNMRVGEVCGCTSGDVDLIVWRDRNRVAMISTYHGVAISDSKPTVVRDYNLCIGGVDKKDQMVSMFPMERKRTQIWYKKFFRRLLNVSILNAYIIYKHNNERTTHRDLRMRVVTELLKRHHTRPVIDVVTTGTPKFSEEVVSHFPAALPTLPGVSSGKQRRQCVLCKKRSHYMCKACNVALCYNPSCSAAETCYVQYHT